MDQELLNKIAWNKIEIESSVIFSNLVFQLYNDRQKRLEAMISEEMIRCIHNAALFNCFTNTNVTGPLKERMKYLRFADTFKPIYFDIAEAMQNFKPIK